MAPKIQDGYPPHLSDRLNAEVSFLVASEYIVGTIKVAVNKTIWSNLKKAKHVKPGKERLFCVHHHQVNKLVINTVFTILNVILIPSYHFASGDFSLSLSETSLDAAQCVCVCFYFTILLMKSTAVCSLVSFFPETKTRHWKAKNRCLVIINMMKCLFCF